MLRGRGFWGVFYVCPWHGVAGSCSLPDMMIFSGSCQAVLRSLTLLPHPSHPASVWNSIDLLFHLAMNGHRPAPPIANPALIPLYLICPAESSAFITYPNTQCTTPLLHSSIATSSFISGHVSLLYFSMYLSVIQAVEVIMFYNQEKTPSPLT